HIASASAWATRPGNPAINIRPACSIKGRTNLSHKIKAVKRTGYPRHCAALASARHDRTRHRTASNPAKGHQRRGSSRLNRAGSDPPRPPWLGQRSNCNVLVIAGEISALPNLGADRWRGYDRAVGPGLLLAHRFDSPNGITAKCLFGAYGRAAGLSSSFTGGFVV